jgi:carbon monoxide dehydrogenase subunit G
MRVFYRYVTCHRSCMRIALSRSRRLISAALLSASTLALPAFAQSDLDVNVQMVGDEIRATVSMFVRAPQQRVWDVVADYERAPEYMRDLQVSKIVSRSGDTVRVIQKDQIHFGPFAFPVETVRDIRHVEPVKTESHLVSGSLKKYDATTELVPENGGTRIRYRSVSIPGSALASMAGESLVKRMTEDRFKQLRAEILRREVVATQQ